MFSSYGLLSISSWHNTRDTLYIGIVDKQKPNMWFTKTWKEKKSDEYYLMESMDTVYGISAPRCDFSAQILLLERLEHTH